MLPETWDVAPRCRAPWRGGCGCPKPSTTRAVPRGVANRRWPRACAVPPSSVGFRRSKQHISKSPVVTRAKLTGCPEKTSSRSTISTSVAAPPPARRAAVAAAGRAARSAPARGAAGRAARARGRSAARRTGHAARCSSTRADPCRRRSTRRSTRRTRDATLRDRTRNAAVRARASGDATRARRSAAARTRLGTGRPSAAVTWFLGTRAAGKRDERNERNEQCQPKHSTHDEAKRSLAVETLRRSSGRSDAPGACSNPAKDAVLQLSLARGSAERPRATRARALTRTFGSAHATTCRSAHPRSRW